MIFLVAFAGTVLIYQKTNKIKKLQFLLWPATDAITNKFDASPDFILARLNRPSYTLYFIENYIRGIKTFFTGHSISTVSGIKR